jgi:2-phospho-L-lactate guanylyltransferase
MQVARSLSMPSPQRPTMWTVIVPVKQTTSAKTRLSGMDADTRRALAIAFAHDTVAAAIASSVVEEVVVVSNDDAAAGIAAAGARVIPDAPSAGLNPALVYAASVVRDRRPSAAIAAISSDLPALRGDDLSQAFAEGPQTSWFVSDAQRVGTTMLAAPAGQAWTPRFGPRSREEHRRLGLVEIGGEGLERLRRDVDTELDLWDAQRLGVGSATRAILATLERRLA